MKQDELISEVVRITRLAGDVILGYYKQDVEIERKSDDSPLTLADTMAHKTIHRELAKLDPSIPILSEEGSIPDYSVRKSWERFWLVDPLDGTKEFIKKNGEFTVNIALIEEGVPVLGVVGIPVKGIIYTGGSETGSCRIDQKGHAAQITSKAPDLSNPLTAAVSRSHGTENLEEKLGEMGVRVGKTITAGSSLKYCLVAEGTADIYPRFGPTMEWDTAAGDAVFRYSGAGGTVRASSLSYNKPDLRNGEFVAGL
ncbi:MAG: 3'(2'),5'-bisphosphate nucleotidase CysQ [Balneolaceae bacterium]